jgi:hypothetical protein
MGIATLAVGAHTCYGVSDGSSVRSQSGVSGRVAILWKAGRSVDLGRSLLFGVLAVQSDQIVPRHLDGC